MNTVQRREFVLGAAGILGASTIGSVAYTTASVDRSVTSTVAADSAAVIGLQAGGAGAVTENGGQLEVDTKAASGSGLNSGGEFTYGEPTSPSSTSAFSITNNDDTTHDLTVSLTGMTLPGSSSFTIQLFQSDSTSIGTVSDGTPVTKSGWDPGNTIYAVIVIDTSGTTGTDEISGTMNFSA